MKTQWKWWGHTAVWRACHLHSSVDICALDALALTTIPSGMLDSFIKQSLMSVIKLCWTDPRRFVLQIMWGRSPVSSSYRQTLNLAIKINWHCGSTDFNNGSIYFKWAIQFMSTENYFQLNIETMIDIKQKLNKRKLTKICCQLD